MITPVVTFHLTLGGMKGDHSGQSWPSVKPHVRPCRVITPVVASDRPSDVCRPVRERDDRDINVLAHSPHNDTAGLKSMMI